MTLEPGTDGPHYWGNRYLGRDGNGMEPTVPEWSRRGKAGVVLNPQNMGRFYFYRVSFSSKMELEFQIHEDILPDNEVMTEEEMTKRIQKIITDKTAPDYTDPDKVNWEGPGYLAFMLDIGTWDWFRTHDKDDASGSLLNYALHFAATYDKNGKPFHHANQSFFNASEFEITDLDGTPKMVLFCKNHHKDPSGVNRAKGDRSVDKYKIDLHCRVEVKGLNRQETIIIDPSGRNTGPG